MIHAAQLSLQGKRSSNQDRILVASPNGAGGIVAAVADGLGGMQAGDKAAEMAVDALRQAAAGLLVQMDLDFQTAREAAMACYREANEAIRAYSRLYAQPGMVGTTMVTLAASGARYLVANVGDSRCYSIADGAVAQVTRDHTLADILLQQGILKPDDYNASPLRNQLTRSLGPEALCEPDIFPDMELGSVRPGQTFLLCSDGFYSKLTDQDLAELACAPQELQATLERLADEALARHTSDNLSAIAVRFE